MPQLPPKCILHITTHLGGGVGTVVLDWVRADPAHTHVILSLATTYDKQCDLTPAGTGRTAVVHENMRGHTPEIDTWIRWADIVVIHFWNHPLLFELLVTHPFPACRVCIWAHVSGFHPPYVFPPRLIQFTDRLVFSSPISYETDGIRRLAEVDRSKLRTIWTCGNVQEYHGIVRRPHDTFNVGYIGTLDYSKLLPHFVELCTRIDIPEIQFFLIGDGGDRPHIEEEIKRRGLQKKFLIPGPVRDIRPYLSIFDVFGYPLNAQHFGTCEQVLGEAIVAGIIPIVMNNPAEAYILHTTPQFLCNSDDEYIAKITALYRDPQSAYALLSTLQHHMLSLYNLQHTVATWSQLFMTLMGQEKTKKVWGYETRSLPTEGHHIFMESLGHHGQIFARDDKEEISHLFRSNLQWRSESKGSVKQYYKAFPADRQLEKWVQYVEQLG